MPAIHDYQCENCKNVQPDLVEPPTSCPTCGHDTLSITYGNWRTMHALEGGTANDELVDSKGFRKKFNVSDDPLCQAELSVGRDKHGVKTFSEEKSQYFRERYVIDGDSPKLRREILRERAKNTGQVSE